MAGEKPGSDLTEPSTIGCDCQHNNRILGGGRTTTVKGVPLEAEPGHEGYLRGMGRLIENADGPTDDISPMVTWTG